MASNPFCDRDRSRRWAHRDRSHGLVATGPGRSRTERGGRGIDPDLRGRKATVSGYRIRSIGRWTDHRKSAAFRAHDEPRTRGRRYAHERKQGSIGQSVTAGQRRCRQGRASGCGWRGGRSMGDVRWRGLERENSAGFSADSGPSQPGEFEVQHQGSLIRTETVGAGACGKFRPPCEQDGPEQGKSRRGLAGADSTDSADESYRSNSSSDTESRLDRIRSEVTL